MNVFECVFYSGFSLSASRGQHFTQLNYNNESHKAENTFFLVLLISSQKNTDISAQNTHHCTRLKPLASANAQKIKGWSVDQN